MQHLQPNTTFTYLATQLSLQRKVAIKEFFMKDFCSRDESTRTMSAPSTGSSKLVEQYRKKFIKEARNLARLNHPNIISVIDVFEENGTVYYVMPYLIGGSLQDYVKTHGVLSEQEAMKYVKQIASALKYMHEEQHICHYDVKPANILLDEKGNAVLIDFGIAKNYNAAGKETTTTPIGMSEGFAPIEQYQQSVSDFSPVSDIYALGATLYFLLHAKRPVSSILRASGESLSIDAQLSLSTKALIKSTMEISQRKRPVSTDVFIRGANLAPIESEETLVEINNNSTPYDDNNKLASRRYWKYWPMAIILLLLLLCVVITYIIFSNKNRFDSENDQSIIVDSDSIALVTPDNLNNLPKENVKMTSLGNYRYSFSGNFVDNSGTYPVELSFKCLDGIVQECIYRNVQIKREISMTAKEGDFGMEFYGKDGSNPFVMRLSSNDAPSRLHGQAEIGSKVMNVELILVEKIGADVLANNEDLENAKVAYENQLKDFSKVDESDNCYYFLYDITKNGIPELWVVAGTCEADKMLYVYTYKNRLQKIFETGAGHSAFYVGDKYVIQQMAHMGAALWNKIYLIQEQLHEKEIYHEDKPEGDYKEPKEQFAGQFPIDNLLPIRAIK